ncbi:MAG: hypothetical protein FD125_1737 [bacterium]|nr:MAG: hypothetical protein FD125_1737 [bacterium]
MTISSPEATPATMRAAGLTYLVVIALGIAGEAVFRGRFIDYQDAAATASAIAADPFNYRLGLVSEAVLLCADVVVAALLYRLFRSAAPALSTLAAMLRLAMVAFSAIRLTLLCAPLLLSNPAAFAPGSIGDLQVISLVLLKLQAAAYGLALIVFGVCCLVKGWMILSSRLAPRLVGVGLLVAGVCYLVNSVGGGGGAGADALALIRAPGSIRGQLIQVGGLGRRPAPFAQRLDPQIDQPPADGEHKGVADVDAAARLVEAGLTALMGQPHRAPLDHRRGQRARLRKAGAP